MHHNMDLPYEGRKSLQKQRNNWFLSVKIMKEKMPIPSCQMKANCFACSHTIHLTQHGGMCHITFSCLENYHSACYVVNFSRARSYQYY